MAYWITLCESCHEGEHEGCLGDPCECSDDVCAERERDTDGGES